MKKFGHCYAFPFVYIFQYIIDFFNHLHISNVAEYKNHSRLDLLIYIL